MAYTNRLEIIKQIEAIRNSKVICFLTTLRPNVPGQIAEDSVRNFFEHLALLPARPIDKLDVFLCSNGGEGTVPWRLISLFREYVSNVGVLIPYLAYSA